MWYSQKQNKYHALSTQYDGLTYHSKKEAAYAAELDLRVKGKDILRWERQVKIPLDITEGREKYHICNYIIDFVVYYPDGIKEYVEVKGFETDIWRIKWKLFEALYSHIPETRLLVVK